MDILFQCNTVYQIMVASQIKATFFKRDICDLIVSDRMNDAERIANSLKKCSLFNTVFFQTARNNNLKTLQKILFVLNKNNLSKLGFGRFDFTKKYDLFLFSNPYFENLVLYKNLLKNNPFCELSFFEDGISTYSKYYEKEYCLAAKGIKGFLMKRNVMKKAKGIYTFSPEFYEWRELSLMKIPSLKTMDKKVLGALNDAFGYKEDVLPPDCRTIFFEESYFGDGKEIGDEKIIRKCIEYFGSKGFYLKNHPRNLKNRFLNSSIKTLQSMSIPWELIVANNIERIEKINLVTITSQTIFTPTILFDLKPSCFFCINAVEDKTVLYPYVSDVMVKIARNCDNYKWMNKEGVFVDHDFA